MMGDWSAEPQGRRFAREGLTIPAVLDAQAAERPDQALLVVDDEPLTYRQLQQRSLARPPPSVTWGWGRGTGWRCSWGPPPSG